MFGIYGLSINTSYYSCQEITANFFLFFWSVYRMSDSYKYDEYSCLDKLIHGESATVHLLFAEYMKFRLDALDVSFSVFV